MSQPTSRLRMPQVFASLNQQPLAVLPAALEALCAQLRTDAEASTTQMADPFAARRAAASAVAGGVAVIPVYGMIWPRPNVFTQYYGHTAASTLGMLVDASVGNPDIGTIVLEFDSPGGSCYMIEETAQIIARAAKKKPVIGMVNAVCASAAYFLASQCTEIVSTPSGMAGNIGVIMMHIDESGWQDQYGIKPQIITSGTYKHEGHGGQPLDESALAAMQTVSDDYYAQFVAAVARGRDVKPQNVRAGMGEGRTLTARQALDAQLVDRIASFEQLLGSLGASVTRSGARADAPELSIAASAPVLGLAAPHASAAGEAAPVRVPLRLEPAATARSTTVTEEELAAAKKKAAEDARAEMLMTERKRVQEISALGREHNVKAETVEKWITDGVSADAVGFEILKLQRDAAKAAQATSSIIVGAPREGNAPFADAGDFLRSVVKAARAPESIDPRLLQIRAAQNVGIGAEGGWAVPESVSTLLLEASLTGGRILSRVTERPITVGNGLKETVVKEEARTAGSRNGGFRHYWVAEGKPLTYSQANLRQIELGLKKVAVAVPITEEQAEDGPQLASFIDEQVPQELRFGMESTIWAGTGAGQPLGFMNTGALITVAIEATQSIANTNQFIWINCAKMFSRAPADMLPGFEWYINQELYAAILTAVSTGTAGAVPMFTMPGQLASAPNGAIFGRPIVPVEYASQQGTVGDIVFANFSDYLFATKGGIKKSVSMHVEFLTDQQVMKFTARCDGQPRTRVPLTPLNGTNTISPYIALGARS